jgi:DNA gyrase subunit B
MKPLLEQGHIYAAQPPTHALVLGSEKEFLYSEQQLQARVADLDRKGRRYRITRFKGLGEMDDDELLETTLNPETRILRRITLEDAKDAEKAFAVMMGAPVEPRKDFIIKHSRDYGHALDI